MIYSYFSKLKAVLNASSLVGGYKVKKEIIGSFVGQIIFEITLKDGSILHGFEYVVALKGKIAREKYRYHWMNENGLIMRWDNAPHHKEIETFPFHIHTRNEILPSEEVRLDEILKTIERLRLIHDSDNT
jgi:hypothetical protein